MPELGFGSEVSAIGVHVRPASVDHVSKTRPDLVREVFRIFKASRDIAIADGNKGAAKLNYGVEANRPTLDAIIDIAFRQKLIPRRYSVDELFDDVTRALV